MINTGRQLPHINKDDMDFSEMQDTINGEVWKYGDGLCRPVFMNGKWTVSSEIFKFLKVQYEDIEKGRAFQFFKEDMGTSRTLANAKCQELVDKLNNK